MRDKLSSTERLALEKQDAQMLTQPLPLGTDPRVMAAHLRHAVRLLVDRNGLSPCSRAVAYLNALFDRSIPAADRQHLACRAGCAHCCQQMVQVHPAEAFFLAAQLQGRLETIAAVQSAAGQAAQDAKGKFWLRCPLLVDGLCSVYDARPLSCRAFASIDVNDCIGYLTPLGTANTSGIRAPAVYSALRNIVKSMSLAAMRLTGLPETAYEMNSALSAIFAQDNAERRWLEGEDIFAGAKAYPLSPLAQAEVARMAAYIAPTL
jgi:Fe-S-cluster containining protein